MLKPILLAGSATLWMAPDPAAAHSVPQTRYLETAKPYEPYEFLIGDWYCKLPHGLVIHQKFQWGPGKSPISYTTSTLLPGRPEEMHFGGTMVWNGQPKELDFPFVLQPGTGAQEKGTVTITADGSVVREIAMTAPDGDVDRFRQTFRKRADGTIVSAMMERTASGWKLDPPGQIVMQRSKAGTGL